MRAPERGKAAADGRTDGEDHAHDDRETSDRSVLLASARKRHVLEHVLVRSTSAVVEFYARERLGDQHGCCRKRKEDQQEHKLGLLPSPHRAAVKVLHDAPVVLW